MTHAQYALKAEHPIMSERKAITKIGGLECPGVKTGGPTTS